MENNQCGLWKTLRQRLGKQPQTEEVRYAVEFERTLRNLEARLHESDNADDIISRTLSTACDFYNANWAGFLEIDMDLGVWAPYVWFNTNPHNSSGCLDMTAFLAMRNIEREEREHSKAQSGGKRKKRHKSKRRRKQDRR